MKRYKPEFLGKVIPADDQTKLTDFVINKYDAFSKIYDSCKEDSDEISDIKTVNNSDEPDSLAVKLSAEPSAVENISKRVQGDDSISMTDDMIIAKVNN